MTAVVFCGPTLSESDLARYPGFEFRPPVRQGDFYNAARDRPRAIGIVDGYFDGQPAVWHKEILWALANRTAVFGASSMGALRAAELHTFGMRGIGKIFEAYRDGALTDDDEVALVHGPAETGYVRLSEPMVNIRATLSRAVSERILSDEACSQLLAEAKNQFYQERNWTTLVDTIADPVASTKFSDWLGQGHVDQKRDDAISMLEAMQTFLEGGDTPAGANFFFEWTENWDAAPWRSERSAGDLSDEQAAIVDETRLDGSYGELRRHALLRALAAGEVEAAPSAPGREAIASAIHMFRSQRGLLRQSDVDRWAQQNDIDKAALDLLLSDTALIEAQANFHDANLHRHMLDRLRELGRYSQMRDRATAKKACPKSHTAGQMPRYLLARWYFETCMEMEMPDRLEEYVASIGLHDIERFYGLVAEEYAFANGNTDRE